jgi:RiboL-PSP-HEPN
MPAVRASHIGDLISNVKEVDRLAAIHATVTKPGPGRKHNVEVLHKSGIVLLVACWEAFIEDLATNAIGAIAQAAPNPSFIPVEVRERIAARLPGRRAWELAGDGWKNACRDHLKEVLGRTVGALNTPKTAQVDELFEKVVGLKGLSTHWRWRGRPQSSCRDLLDNLIVLRGSIAHRVTTATGVNKSNVLWAREFLFRLAVRSHNVVNRHVASLTGEEPWIPTHYGQTE